METIGFILLLWLVFFLGAISHEIDMVRCIRKMGHTRYSCWTANIVGTVEEKYKAGK